MTDEIGAQTSGSPLQQSVNTNATNALAPTSSHCWQRLISNAAHHRLEILAHLAWKAEVFDDRHGPQQGQDANVVHRECAVDGFWTLDQTIEFLKIGCKVVDIGPRFRPQY